MGHRKQAFFVVLLSFVTQWVSAAEDPYNSFCRRFGHQTTVIDDKLYIDGGFVNFDSYPVDHLDVPNTWNSFHDLNNLTTGISAGWPQLNINLNKDPNVIPTVAGGVLWGDSINKSFYVFGGDSTSGPPQNFHQFKYDIVHDTWADLGPPKTPTPPLIASYGAGIGVSETGEGFYYGGYVSNTSMLGWTRPSTTSSNFYKYDYDANNLTLLNSPDGFPRAEGVMTWIPAGNTGMIVYLGGLVDPNGDGNTEPQSMDKILIYDPSASKWFTQTATGQIPQNRGLFCGQAAWAEDRSSYNIYVWGGRSIPSPTGNFTVFNDVYILSLPSFIWVKVFPNFRGNSTYVDGHYSSSCNMVKSSSQMFVIGGHYLPGTDNCDGAQLIWGQHDFWTGTFNNSGNSDIFWALYDPNVTSYVVPIDVYGVVGGDENGNATLLSPRSNYDPGNSDLEALLKLKPTFCRGQKTPNNCTQSSTHSHISTGVIVGIAIGSVAALVLLVFGLYLARKRAQMRKEERRRLEMTQGQSKENDTSRGPWEADSRYNVAELDTQQNSVIGELPE